MKRAWDSIPPALRRWQISEEGILAIKVCDKACGSGHFLVGAAHRLARHLARVRALAQGESEPSPLLYQTALRDVIGHCLYGVDINPMAVELCKVTLWLEALEPGKPLSFLDHHIRCGNSLLGATPELIKGGIPEEAYAAIQGDDKEACSALKKQNKRENPKLGEWFIADEAAIRDKLFQAAAAIDEMSDSRPEDIQRKEAAFRAAQKSYDFQKAWDLANLWCAAFVIKKRFPESAVPLATDDRQSAITETPGEAATPLPAWFGVADQDKKPKAKGRKPSTLNYPTSTAPIGITTQHLRDFVEGGAIPDGLLAAAKQLADQYQFFHWHLAFPEVFAQGGFDVNLGNPPWERVKLQEKEWFAERSPEIANAPNPSDRKRLIEELKAKDFSLHLLFLADSRKAEGESHLLRSGGVFPLCGRGDINLYAVFAERMRNMIHSAGRVGAVLPSGIATDDTTKFFFQDVVEKRALVSFFDFENRQGLFPAVDSRMKFCLFTSGSPVGGAVYAAKFVFFAHVVNDLLDPDRQFTLSAEDIALLNPITRTCPVFRSRRDAELTKSVYRRIPVLRAKEGQAGTDERAWDVTLFTMLHSSGAAHLFLDTKALSSRAVSQGNIWLSKDTKFMPLYEGKMFHQFDHRFAGVVMTDNLARPAQPFDATAEQKQDADWLPTPRLWVSFDELANHCPDGLLIDWFLGYKDVGSATNERTLIASILPQAAVVDSVNLVGLRSSMAGDGACLLANFNSFALDYVVRQKTGGLHIKFYLLNQLPILPPRTYLQSLRWTSSTQPFRNWLLPRVLELTYTAWDLESFAQHCGWTGPPFRWDQDRRFLLRCELDAAFFHLYLGPETEWMKQPEALTRAFPSPRHAVDYILDTFPIVKRKDEAKFNGDYRTKRLILEIYDALAAAMQTGKAYQTRLDPPPADPRCCHPPKTNSSKT